MVSGLSLPYTATLSRAGTNRPASPVQPRSLPLDTIAVIDFETTGLSPAQGARATEIAAVLVREGEIVDRYPAHLPPHLERELRRRFGLAAVTHELLGRIQTAPRRGLERCVERYGDRRD